jgi:hypothetical protein
MGRTLPIILLWDENFDVRSDTGTPVDDRDYQAPFSVHGDTHQAHADDRPAEAQARRREAAKTIRRGWPAWSLRQPLQTSRALP